MNKTLHKKLTEKHLYEHAHTIVFAKGDLSSQMADEVNLLKEAAQDLLQPRPQAIANILRMAREL